MKTKYEELCEIIRNDAINDFPLTIKRIKDLAPYMIIKSFGAVGFGVDGHLYVRRFTENHNYGSPEYVEESNSRLIDYIIWASRFDNGHYYEGSASRSSLDKGIDFITLCCYVYFNQSISEEVAHELYKLAEDSVRDNAVNPMVDISPEEKYAIVRSFKLTHKLSSNSLYDYIALQYANTVQKTVEMHIGKNGFTSYESGELLLQQLSAAFFEANPVKLY